MPSFIALADDKYQHNEPRSWNLPCFAEVDLEFRGGCFGQGVHRDYQGQLQAGGITVSRVIKDQNTWELVTENGYYADFFGKSNSDNQRQRYFTISQSLSMVVGCLLVDVFYAESEVSFLVADSNNYTCYQLRKKPIVPAPQGSYLLPAHAANSENWYVHRIVQLQQLGYKFPAAKHASRIAGIRLSGINTLEVLETTGGALEKSIDFSSGFPVSNGFPVLSDPWDPKFPTAPWTEQKIIEYFSSFTAEEISDQLLRFEGGKEYILSILTQLQDQEAALGIKNKILEAGS